MPAATILPRALRPGDTLGIVAASSPVREELLARGEQALASLGFGLRRGPHVLARDRYTAGSADQRAADLGGFLADPDIRGIFFARGGYGAPHLLSRIDPAALRRDPKPLIGASDVTALLLWSLKAGVACLHGPMPAREFQEGRVDLPEIHRLLTSGQPLGPVAAPELRVLHPGRQPAPASGFLTGGCLSLVVSSLGTPWEIDTRGAILFLEDVDTKPYQIDRMLTQLRLAGKLEAVAGIAFGQMPGCLQNQSQGYTLDEVLADLTADLRVPVVAGLPCGHTPGLHRALPLGVPATLDTGRGELRVDGPLCAPAPVG